MQSTSLTVILFILSLSFSNCLPTPPSCDDVCPAEPVSETALHRRIIDECEFYPRKKVTLRLGIPCSSVSWKKAPSLDEPSPPPFQPPTPPAPAPAPVSRTGTRWKKSSDETLIYGLTSIRSHDAARDSVSTLCGRARMQKFRIPGLEPDPMIGTTGTPIRNSDALLHVELNTEHGINRIWDEAFEELLAVLRKQSTITINGFQPNTITSYTRPSGGKAHWWSSTPKPQEGEWIVKLYFVPELMQT